MIEEKWFVMRDLKRSNAKLPAYKMLANQGIRIFTPLTWKVSLVCGKRIREQVPFIPDLLFVFGSRKELDPIVDKTYTLQYRYLRNTYREPMTVRTTDMERFIQAATLKDTPQFYMPEEITADMLGHQVRIIGGPLTGYEGRLQKIQGSRVKRLFVELPNLLTVAVEVRPEFIELLKA